MKLLVALVMLTTLFPYVVICNSTSYNQPFSLVFAFFLSLLLLIRSDLKFLKLKAIEIIFLVSFGITGIVLFVFSNHELNQQMVKYLVPYIAPLIYLPAFTYCLKNNRSLSISIMKFALFSWFFVSFIQYFVQPQFGSFLMGSWSASFVDIANSGRGVCGLAPEPWYHSATIIIVTATMCILQPKQKLWTCMAVIELFLFARSASGILCILLGAVLFAILNKSILKKLRYILFLTLCIAVMSQLSSLYGTQDRLRLIIEQIKNKSLENLFEDASINARVSGVIASIKLACKYKLLPQGLSNEKWLFDRHVLLRDHPFISDLSEVGLASGIGILLYQAGFFAVFLIYFLFSSARVKYQADLAKIFIISSYFVICFQFSLSSGLFWLMIASLRT